MNTAPLAPHDLQVSMDTPFLPYQCSRLKSSMPFKCDLALRNIPSENNSTKRNPKLKMKTSLEVLNINLFATGTNKRMELSLQEVGLDGSFFILYVVLKTCTISFMHKFNMSFFLSLISFLYSWIDVLDLNQPFN